MWRLLCDQNVRVDTVERLREEGYDAISTRDLGLSLASDDEILSQAVQQNRVVITFDLDFANIRRFSPETHCGVIRLRIYPQDPASVHQALLAALNSLTQETLAGRIAVVDRKRVRIRPAL